MVSRAAIVFARDSASRALLGGSSAGLASVHSCDHSLCWLGWTAESRQPSSGLWVAVLAVDWVSLSRWAFFLQDASLGFSMPWPQSSRRRRRGEAERSLETFLRVHIIQCLLHSCGYREVMLAHLQVFPVVFAVIGQDTHSHD